MRAASGITDALVGYLRETQFAMNIYPFLRPRPLPSATACFRSLLPPRIRFPVKPPIREWGIIYWGPCGIFARNAISRRF